MVKVTFFEPSPLAASGVIQSIPAGTETVQGALEVTSALTVPPAASASREAGLTRMDGVRESWLTRTEAVLSPALTVTVEERASNLSFAVTVILKEPFPVPEAGETVTHASGQDTVQSKFEVTPMLFSSAPVASKLAARSDRESSGITVGVQARTRSPATKAVRDFRVLVECIIVLKIDC